MSKAKKSGPKEFTDEDIASIPKALGLRTPVPVVVIIGGAAALDPPADSSEGDEDPEIDTDELSNVRQAVERTFFESLRPAIQQTQAVVLTGGTQAGVMRMAGTFLSDVTPALIGVTPDAMVHGKTAKTILDPMHAAFVLTSGARWGSETEILFKLAELLTRGTAPGVVVLANGGDISFEEARRFLRGGWPIITVSGSGGAAQDLTDAVNDAERESRWGDLHQADVESLVKDRALARRQLLWRLHPDELLKSAWSTFASYDRKASLLKRSARRSRWILTGLTSALLVAVTATVQFAFLGWITVDGTLDPDLRNDWVRSILPIVLTISKLTVLVLPVGIAVAAALGSFSGSQLKWRAVRASAETLKREIYRYRSILQLDKNAAINRLAAVLHVVDDEAIRANIGLAETPTGLTRGRPSNVDVDELELLNPRIYIKRRLEHQVLWFGVAARARRRSEWIVVMLGAVAASTAMALVNTKWAPWVVLLVLGATVFAFSRERGLTRQQVTGFDRAIADVNDAWIEWLQKPSTDRVKAKSLAYLVDSVERAFERESLSWSEVMRRAAQQVPVR